MGAAAPVTYGVDVGMGAAMMYAAAAAVSTVAAAPVTYGVDVGMGAAMTYAAPATTTTIAAPAVSYAAPAAVTYAAAPAVSTVAAAPHMAVVGLDLNHNGRADAFVIGADQNFDGIPDVLEQGQRGLTSSAAYAAPTF